jgi:hypothetical protein
VFQQAEVCLLERLRRLGTHAPLFRLPDLVDLVDRVGSEPFDIEPVEDHLGLRHSRPQRFLPTGGQIRRHQRNAFAPGRSQQVEEPLQPFSPSRPST